MVEAAVLLLILSVSTAGPGLTAEMPDSTAAAAAKPVARPACPDTALHHGPPCRPQDRDGDGIPDSLDKCPDEPEIYNFYQDEDGCPDQRPDPVRDGVIPGLHFDSGQVRPESTATLDSLAAALKFYSGTQLEIHGYIDDIESRGPSDLSLQRARFVQTYLESLGVDSRRLTVQGLGNQPIASNRTGAGRTQNRRVEIEAH